MKVKFKIEGMNELQKSLKKLGKVPQKYVNSASKKGMNIILKAARADSPYQTGNLKRGTILVGEKSKTKGKKVYRIVFDRNMNDIFQKPVINPGESGNKKARKIAYYPVSQEYGFFTRNGKYIPGFRFIHGNFEKNMTKASKIMVETMKQKVDQEIAKAGLK